PFSFLTPRRRGGGGRWTSLHESTPVCPPLLIPSHLSPMHRLYPLHILHSPSALCTFQTHTHTHTHPTPMLLTASSWGIHNHKIEDTGTDVTFELCTLISSTLVNTMTYCSPLPRLCHLTDPQFIQLMSSIHTYTHTYIHTRTQTYIHTYIHTC